MVSTMHALGMEYIRQGDFEQANATIQDAFVLSTQIKYYDGEAMSLKYMGNIEFMKGNYMEVLPYWTRALERSRDWNRAR